MNRMLAVKLGVGALLVAVLAVACTGSPTSDGGSGDGTEGSLAVGDLGPAFSLPAADGGTISLADYTGRPVLLYFSMGPG